MDPLGVGPYPTDSPHATKSLKTKPKWTRTAARRPLAVGNTLVVVGVAVRAGDRVEVARTGAVEGTARRSEAVGKALVVVGLAVRRAGDRVNCGLAGAAAAGTDRVAVRQVCVKCVLANRDGVALVADRDLPPGRR